ncbi:MAG: hypothetical protein IT385_18945 [Deltaproteobacteria bacterium]|nr:hypothetical protein [Deltaproteobacteria bacterium]
MAVDCDKLRDAIARNVRKVKNADGDEVEYASLADMIKVHEMFCGPIVPPTAETADTSSIATTYAVFCKRGTR